jgi:hypothetical protein
MTKQAHRPQEETRRLMLAIVAQSPQPVTRAQIMTALNRRKTPHLTALLDEFVAQGIFVREVHTFHNGVQGYVYRLAPLVQD